MSGQIWKEQIVLNSLTFAETHLMFYKCSIQAFFDESRATVFHTEMLSESRFFDVLKIFHVA